MPVPYRQWIINVLSCTQSSLSCPISRCPPTSCSLHRGAVLLSSNVGLKGPWNKFCVAVVVVLWLLLLCVLYCSKPSIYCLISMHLCVFILYLPAYEMCACVFIVCVPFFFNVYNVLWCNLRALFSEISFLQLFPIFFWMYPLTVSCSFLPVSFILFTGPNFIIHVAFFIFIVVLCCALYACDVHGLCMFLLAWILVLTHRNPVLPNRLVPPLQCKTKKF